MFETVPLTIAVMGVCLIALAISQRQVKNVLSMDTVSWGLLMFVIGFMGFLYGRNIYSGFFIPAILIVLGLIGLMAVLRSWGKTA